MPARILWIFFLETVTRRICDNNKDQPPNLRARGVDNLLRGQLQSRGKNSSLHFKKIIPQFALIESSNGFPLTDRESWSSAAIAGIITATTSLSFLSQIFSDGHSA